MPRKKFLVMQLRLVMLSITLSSELTSIQIYRCWIVWDRDWRVIVLPSILSIISMSKSRILLWTIQTM